MNNLECRIYNLELRLKNLRFFDFCAKPIFTDKHGFIFFDFICVYL
jgi:hypothetical protein